MQKILPFEISVAIKDRPRTFQIITLVLFFFCITVILIGSFQRATSSGQEQQVVKRSGPVHYAGVVSTSSLRGVQR